MTSTARIPNRKNFTLRESWMCCEFDDVEDRKTRPAREQSRSNCRVKSIRGACQPRVVAAVDTEGSAAHVYTRRWISKVPHV